jgi:5-methylcytosine-specific restriction enzyme subunit McrC
MRIELIEQGSPELIRLTPDESVAVAQSGLVEVAPTSESGWWELRPGSSVGVVTVGVLEIRVAPKIPIDRIIYMLGYGLRGVTWQEAPVPVDLDTDVIQVLGQVFTRSVAEALKPGMLQAYRVTEEALPVVRGRIRIDEQLKRYPGQWMPLEVSYDDFTVDIAENRIVRSALEQLLRNSQITGTLRHQLTALELKFADVARLIPGQELPVWNRSRLNQRYHFVLEIAELILASSSFEHRVGEVRIDGFVLDLARIFEDFVTAALRDALVPLSPGSSVIGQYGTWLDEGGQVALRPDVVWLDPSLVPLAVLDAKYKAEKPSGFPNADIYQAFAYATALGLGEAHLIYAQGNEIPKQYVVTGPGVVVRAHALDLAVPPAQLLKQVGELAVRVHALIPLA